MSKMTKTIAALGVVAGLGVAAMPLSTYALDDTEQVNLTVEVGQSIEIIADATSVDLGEATSSAMATGGTGITVHTNNEQGYTATIKADGSRLTGTTDNSNAIPTSGTSVAPVNGTSAWGYAIGSLGDASSNNYVAASTTAQEFASTSTTSAQAGDKYNLTFAVSVASNQAADTYKGSVTLTATAK